MTRPNDIEALARMAARLAGRDPDAHVRVKLGEVVAFDDAAWRYPDFLVRAEAAYEALTGELQPANGSGPKPLECYRYRTPALAGPWRRRPERALGDAVKAGQAELDGDGEVHWTVSGKIERSECGSRAPCGGHYPPE